MTVVWISLIGTAIASFWGWLAVSVVKTNAKVAEIEQRINARTEECAARLVWMRQIDLKMNAVAEDTAFIRGKLESGK